MITTVGLYSHRMRVWRDTGQRDRLGNRDMQVTQTESGFAGMAQVAEDVPCRWNGEAGGLRMEERSTLVFVTTTTVYCDPYIDIHEADRIQVYEPNHGTILLQDGIVLLIEPTYSIGQVHHLEISVKTIRGVTF